jgi:Tfp pilus assembly protein PilN
MLFPLSRTYLLESCDQYLKPNYLLIFLNMQVLVCVCVCFHFLLNLLFRKWTTTIATDPILLHGCHVFLARSLSKCAASELYADLRTTPYWYC